MGYEWKDSLRGAGQGAMAGSFGGPIGMLIGALTGGALGGFGDDLDKRITGDSSNNITDQMLSLASLAGGMGGGSGAGSAVGGMPNLEFADGSGRYLAGNSPLQGQVVDGNFLSGLSGMFGEGGGGMSPDFGSGGFNPQSFDWSNILKMLGSAGTMGSSSEQAQPTSYGMTPRLPVPIAPVMPQATRGEGYYQTWLQKNNLG